jgi:hypothetical protein
MEKTPLMRYAEGYATGWANPHDMHSVIGAQHRQAEINRQFNQANQKPFTPAPQTPPPITYHPFTPPPNPVRVQSPVRTKKLNRDPRVVALLDEVSEVLARRDAVSRSDHFAKSLESWHKGVLVPGSWRKELATERDLEEFERFLDARYALSLPSPYGTREKDNLSDLRVTLCKGLATDEDRAMAARVDELLEALALESPGKCRAILRDRAWPAFVMHRTNAPHASASAARDRLRKLSIALSVFAAVLLGSFVVLVWLRFGGA